MQNILLILAEIKDQMSTEIYQRQENDVATIMANWKNPIKVQYSVTIKLVADSTLASTHNILFDPQ